jgi:hypothetical protein
LAKSFKAAVIDRIENRRDPTLISLILYLSNHDALNKPSSLRLTAKASAVRLGLDLLNRLSGNGEEPEAENDENIENVDLNLSFQDRLRLAVGSVKPTQETSGTRYDNFKKEFQYYERNRRRSPILDELFLALQTIQPTSAQSERNFPLASSIVSKLRTRLKDSHVNALCFLKSYFLANKC